MMGLGGDEDKTENGGGGGGFFESFKVKSRYLPGGTSQGWSQGRGYGQGVGVWLEAGSHWRWACWGRGLGWSPGRGYGGGMRACQGRACIGGGCSRSLTWGSSHGWGYV